MQRINFIAKLGVSLALTGYLFTRLDLQKIWQTVGDISPMALIPVLALGVLGIVLSAWKWARALRHLGLSLPFSRALNLFWVGVFFNNFLPGRTGGDLVRAYGLAKYSQNPLNAALSVIIDRGFNIIALIAIGVFAFLLAGTPLPLELDLSRLTVLSVIAASIGVMGIVYHILKNRIPGLRNLQEKTIAAGRILWHSPAQVLFFLCLAGLYQISMIFAHVVVAQILKIDVSIPHFFYLVPITAVVTLLPISINGIGVRESAFAFALAHVGASVELAVTLSLIITLCTLLLSLIGGFLYIKGTRPGPVSMPEPSSTQTILPC